MTGRVTGRRAELSVLCIWRFGRPRAEPQLPIACPFVGVFLPGLLCFPCGQALIS